MKSSILRSCLAGGIILTCGMGSGEMIPAAHAALAGTSQTAPAAAENAPLFTTDITVLSDGRIVTSNKGNKSVRIYAPDNLAAPVKEWIFEQTPTGVAAGTSGGSEKYT